jgi:hypothetical protein
MAQDESLKLAVEIINKGLASPERYSASQITREALRGGEADVAARAGDLEHHLDVLPVDAAKRWDIVKKISVCYLAVTLRSDDIG